MVGIFLLVTAVLPQISESIFSPCLPELVHDFSQPMSNIELVFSYYLFGYALGMLGWGGISDWVGRIKTLQFGLCVYMLASIFCAIAPSIHAMYLMRFIQGIGGSACSVLVIAMCRDYFEGKYRGKMMAKIGMIYALGPMLGPPLGGLIIAYYRWNFIFFPLAVYALFLLKYSKSIESKQSTFILPSIDLYAKMFKSMYLWFYGLLIGSCCSVGFTFFSEAPTFFIGGLHLTPQAYSLGFILVGLSWFLGGKINHYLLNFMRCERVMEVGIKSALASVMMFALTIALVLGPLYTLLLSWIWIIAIMTSLSLVIGNAFTMALEPFGQQAGIAASVLGFIQYATIGFYTLFIAHMHTGSMMVMPLVWLLLIVTSYLMVRQQSSIG